MKLYYHETAKFSDRLNEWLWDRRPPSDGLYFMGIGAITTRAVR